jgi:hypothetical protein
MARTIVPPQDPLRCVAATQKLDRGSGVRGAEFAGDVDEQSAFGYSDAVESAHGAGSGPQHRDTILQHRAFDLFVRIRARHHADDLIGYRKARLDQRQVRASERVERARQDADSFDAHVSITAQA